MSLKIKALYTDIKSAHTQCKKLNKSRRSLRSDRKAVEKTDKKFETLKPQTQKYATDYKNLKGRIRKLQKFYDTHKTAKFLTHKILGNLSPLKKAKAEQKLFEKTIPLRFKRELNNFNKPQTPNSPLPKLPAQSPAPAQDQLPPQSPAPIQVQAPANPVWQSALAPHHDRLYANYTQKAPQTTTIAGIEDEGEIEKKGLTIDTFADLVEELFAAKDKEAASDLADEIVSEVPDAFPTETNELEILLDRCLSVIDDGFKDLHLGKDEKYNREFIQALLFGRDDPKSYITNHTIGKPVISKEQFLKKFAILGNQVMQERLALKCATSSEEEILNAFANLATLKHYLTSNTITFVKPMLKFWGPRFIDTAQVEQFIFLPSDQFNSQFGFVD